MDPGMKFLIIVTVLYFLPSFVAMLRGHHNKVAVWLLNLILGWTVIGWIAALIWAATEPRWMAEARVRRAMKEELS